jgi:hypothetical protein
MTAPEELWEAQRILGKYWKQDQSPEQAAILGLARDALDFISATGQRYRFRGYRQRASSGAAAGGGQEGLLQQAERFFERLLGTPSVPEEKELLRVVVDALRFITATGQSAGLEDYIQHLEAGAPPYVVAAFGTQEEAEAWLREHSEPPDFAHILVAGEYRSVFHDPQSNVRKLPADHTLEYYLAELREAEPPVAAATFASREEAESWLKAQPERARRMWISVGGQLYLAAYYPQLHHGALFPLSMAEGFQV